MPRRRHDGDNAEQLVVSVADGLGASVHDLYSTGQSPRAVASTTSWEGDLSDLDMEYTVAGRGSQPLDAPVPVGMRGNVPQDVADSPMQQRRMSSQGTSTSRPSHLAARGAPSVRHTDPLVEGAAPGSRRRQPRPYSTRGPREGVTSTDPPGGPVNDDKALTRQITNCARTAELYRLWESRRGSFNHVHVAATLSCLAKVG